MTSQDQNLAQVQDAILQFLQEQKVMTVSVADVRGVPWAVPVFFVNDRFKLYWLSKSSGRIGAYLAENPRAVITTIATDENSSQLRGLQAEGAVAHVRNRLERLRVLKRFLTSHPDTVRQMAGDTGSSLIGRLSNTSIYRIEPDRCWFTDHSKGFGSRVELNLNHSR